MDPVCDLVEGGGGVGGCTGLKNSWSSGILLCLLLNFIYHNIIILCISSITTIKVLSIICSFFFFIMQNGTPLAKAEWGVHPHTPS